MTLKVTKLRYQKAPLAVPTNVPTLSEAFSSAHSDAGVIGFILSQRPQQTTPVLWVQDRLSRKEAGLPYLPGMRHKSILHVDVSRPTDVLWAMEEGLRCKALSCVIGEVWGDPPALSFTATKRLAMRAETNDIACWLIRRAASPDLSAARHRWRITSLPSAPHPHDPQSPGAPRWQAELFRSRSHTPGTWVVSYDRAADRIDFTSPLRDREMAEGHGTARQHATR
jgi:protein ImuA